MRARQVATRVTKKALLQAANFRPLRPGVRVLTYHEFPSVSEFTKQLDMLQEETTLIGEAQFLSLVRGERAWPTDRLEVLITADDGYACQFDERLLNLVAARKVEPLLFLIGCALAPDELAQHSQRLEHDEHGRDRPLVSLSALREGMHAGWTIGGHTQTHVNGSTMDATLADTEIADAADRIEQALQSTVSSFAWPWGKRKDTNDASMRVVTSRFDAAFSTHRGPVTTGVERHFIPREDVSPTTTTRELRGMLAGALDRVGA